MTRTPADYRQLQDRYLLLTEKIGELQKAADIEAGAAARFQLKKQLEDAEAERQKVTARLEQIEAEAQPGDGEKVSQPNTETATDQLDPVHNFFEPCRFDLDNIAEKGLRTIIARDGLIGFAFRCQSLAVLKQCCHRIRLELGRSNLVVREPFVIHPKFKSVELGVQDVLRHRKLLERQHVMLAVQISDEENANRFWSALGAQLSERVAHKLIVLLAVGEGCAFPEGTVALETPLFERIHAYRWVRELVKAMHWPEDFIDFWIDNLVKECAAHQSRDELYPDHVYIHIDETLRFIRSNPKVADFRAELIRREQIYVPS